MIAAGAALFGFFQLSGGSLMPVSALVKGYQVDRFSLGAFYNWSLVLFPLRIQGANLLNVLGIVAMCASFWKLVRMRVDAGDTDVRRDAARGDCPWGVGVHPFAGHVRHVSLLLLLVSVGVVPYWTIVFSSFLVEFVERRAWGLPCRGDGRIRRGRMPIVRHSWWLTEPPNNLAATRYRGRAMD